MQTSSEVNVPRFRTTRPSISDDWSVENSLTSSLPSSESFQKMMKIKRPPALSRQNSLNNTAIAQKGAAVQQDYGQRPRSASLQIGTRSASLQVGGTNPRNSPLQSSKRKARRMLSRSRPSSGKSHSDSLSLEEEVTAGTRKVESAFARIKSQLAHLSQEDTELQERLDRMALEIASMQRHMGRLQNYPTTDLTPSVLSPKEGVVSSNFIIPMVMISSGSQPDGLVVDCWDEGYRTRSKAMEYEEDERVNFLDIVNMENLNNSQESFLGSFTDYSGYLSPRLTDCLVAMDRNKHLPQSPRAFSFEDDVFQN